MTPFIAGLVLLAALLHAGWNAMAKSGGTPQFSIASYRLVSALCCLPLLFLFPIPLAASWPMLLASMVIHTLYYVTLSNSYRSGDLSQVYPLFRGLAPVLVLLGAALLAGEYVSPGAMLGIGLVSAGLISITFAGGALGKISSAALGWGLATSVLIAAYTVADGMGVRAAGNPFSYIIWLFILEPIPIGSWLLLRDRAGWFGYIRKKPGKICAGAFAAAAAYAMVIYAMGVAPMAMVSSLRETSVIFAALIGTLLFREPFGRQRVIAAILVCCGVVVIKILN
ncbi:MAG: EamA family transporter [Gammaproteobacteria bacterium]|nr:EamA family transporter [Gammaproteobacteria bacterium]MDH3536344.1 EamA family transporter [Gammaproteobacteria bacterium]